MRGRLFASGIASEQGGLQRQEHRRPGPSPIGRLLKALRAKLPSARADAPDNAGIFFYGPPPAPETLAEAAVGASTSIERSGDQVQVIATWPDVSIRFTIDPGWNRGVQLSGIRGWLSTMQLHGAQQAVVASFLSRLDETTTCYGSVITPAYDKQGKVAATLLRVLRDGGGGFLFSHQSFYNQHGYRIAGGADDPGRLGA